MSKTTPCSFCNESTAVDKHILENIALYLDDELQEGERLAVEAHVKGCADCRAALDAERELISAIRKARPAYRTPPALREKVAKLLAEPRHRHGSFRFWIPIAACALLALGVALSWFAAAGPFREDANPFVDTAGNKPLSSLQGRMTPGEPSGLARRIS